MADRLTLLEKKVDSLGLEIHQLRTLVAKYFVEDSELRAKLERSEHDNEKTKEKLKNVEERVEDLERIIEQSPQQNLYLEERSGVPLKSLIKTESLSPTPQEDDHVSPPLKRLRLLSDYAEAASLPESEIPTPPALAETCSRPNCPYHLVLHQHQLSDQPQPSSIANQPHMNDAFQLRVLAQLAPKSTNYYARDEISLLLQALLPGPSSRV